MFRSRILTAAAVLVAFAPSHAQQPPPGAAAGLKAMKAISFFAGRWEGEGWIRQGPGEPEKFRGAETVESRLDGRVLIIEGLHRDPSSNEIVHHALATISYDPQQRVYRFRSHLSNGRAGDYEGRLEDGAFVWGSKPARAAFATPSESRTAPGTRSATIPPKAKTRSASSR